MADIASPTAAKAADAVVTVAYQATPARPGKTADRATSLNAARGLNRAAATLAASVLADSAIEHYRGSFENRMMFVPLISSALNLAVSAHGIVDQRGRSHPVRNVIYTLAAATGVAGTGFHLYNIGKREGGLSWINLFFAAPVGAPAALALSGMLGFLSERLRDMPLGVAPRLLGLPAGRTVAAITGAGIAGTVGEVGLLHFRGSFHDPFMVLPVAAPPVAAALIAATALLPKTSPALRRTTRWWLRFTALLGFAGAGFHVYGVGRGMRGWRNWSQNLLNGPPIPAPPSFTGLAIAGLAALRLLGGDTDD
ncbi:hypothetical protein [Rhodopila sp.]|uniref:hypothetical protein n=1 Tax=Rhodopila sp. TaxID=2480087 RepID=UPI003D0BFFE1